jgi:2-oxoglutarate ferredoxin oxidoreductase subunit gamma
MGQIILEATVVAAMNLPSLVKFERILKPDGQLFINTSLIRNLPSRNDLEIWNINANEIAAGLGSDKVANMVVLGAIVNKTGMVRAESIEKAMEKLIKGDKEKLLPLNRQALGAWEG